LKPCFVWDAGAGIAGGAGKGGGEIGGGRGRCNRDAARRSPGASNATAGRPYVAPRRLAKEPPNE